MFGISFTELLVIMMLVLVIFGPEKLPEIANSLGRFMGTMRRNTDAIRREFYNSVYQPAQDVNKSVEGAKRNLTAMLTEFEDEEVKPDPLCPDSQKTVPQSPEQNAVPKDPGDDGTN